MMGNLFRQDTELKTLYVQYVHYDIILSSYKLPISYARKPVVTERNPIVFFGSQILSHQKNIISVTTEAKNKIMIINLSLRTPVLR